MDDADRAAPEIERYILEAARHKKPEGPVPTGRCLYCDEITDDVHRWCNAGCREGWEALERLNRRRA